MGELIARLARGEVKPAQVATFLWEVPQKPVAVRLAFDIIDRMESEIIENFRSLTSRGSEIGGVLLGWVLPGSPLTVIVQDYETVPCDYSHGLLYRLSDADLARFERVIKQHSGSDTAQAVGFFRAHSRKGLSLDSDDVAFLDARFRAPHHVALLVRPFATKTSVGRIIIREDGTFHSEASYLEFPFRSAQLEPSLWTPPEPAAPAPVAPPASAAPSAAPARPRVRPQVVPILRRDTAPAEATPDAEPFKPSPVDRTDREAADTRSVGSRGGADAATSEQKPMAWDGRLIQEVPGSATARPAFWALTVSFAKEAVNLYFDPLRRILVRFLLFARHRRSPATSAASPDESQGAGKLMMVLGGIAAVLAILVVLFVYPGYMARSHQTTAAESAAAELTLRVEPSGTDLLLTWNKNSSAIANASHGVLSINDGDRHEDYDMDGNQLTTGTIMYTPVTGDVSFKMEVTGKNQIKTVTESVRSLRTRPSPMTDGKSPAASTAAKANPAQPLQPGAPATTAQPGPPAPTPAPAEVAHKDFNTESLAMRLRPASPTEIADAGLGAAPTSPAGVNVNSSLNMPFANAPAPVAPAPPITKSAASSGKVASAQLVYRKEPEYPTAARQMNAKGQVVLEATIGTDGRVLAVKVISGHPLLVQAAKAAVMQWRYRPTLLDGQPVENTTQISLYFVGTH
jgi:protein TonB